MGLPQAASDTAPVALKMTGRLALTPKQGRRFNQIAATLARTESGEAALVSKINGQFWTTAVRGNSLTLGPDGLLYFGTSVRPAFRMQFMDSVTNKRADAALSFDTESDRDKARAFLLEPPRPAATV